MYRRVIATRLSTDFVSCTTLETLPIPTAASLKMGEVLVRNHFVGINASDINYTAGKYRPTVKPPFACGMESIGIVEAVDQNKKGPLSVGDAVICSDFGGFSEYQVVSPRYVRRVPRVDPRYLALEISGTTASIALEYVAQPQKGEVALVTAAAGATGLFAVQLLKKLYGCYVIGTCSGEAKSSFLKNRLGCDEVIDYKLEDVASVLSNRKGGVNIAYEGVGGAMLDAVLENVAIRGRIVTIGGISSYASGDDWAAQTKNARKIPQLLLMKSASLRGFFLPHYGRQIDDHFNRLLEKVDKGEIESCVDETTSFTGLEQVGSAVNHLHARKNIGKVVVKLQPQ